MKNASNLGFVVIIVMILACSCPKETTPGNNSSADRSRTPASDSAQTPADEAAASEPPEPPKTSSPASTIGALSLEKYNRINYGMSYEEVIGIIGFDGRIIKVSPDGTVRYVWGDDFTFIMITFMEDKVAIKSQNNLDK